MATDESVNSAEADRRS